MKLVNILIFFTTIISNINASQFSPYKPSPIVDPSIILYVSDHLSSQQCYGLVNYLMSQCKDVNYCRNKILSVGGISPNSFACRLSLKVWNEEIVSNDFKSSDSIDKLNIAESLLKMGLNSINRPDIVNWFKNVQFKRNQYDISREEKEIARHIKDGLAEEKNAGQEVKSSKLVSTKQQNEAPTVKKFNEGLTINKISNPLKKNVDKKKSEEVDFVFYIIICILVGIVVFLILFVSVVKLYHSKTGQTTTIKSQPYEQVQSEEDIQ